MDTLPTSVNATLETLRYPVNVAYLGEPTLTVTHKVHWKGDWALSIGQYDFDPHRVCLSLHWTGVGSLRRTFLSVEAATAFAYNWLYVFEQFLIAKWFMPKLPGVPGAKNSYRVAKPSSKRRPMDTAPKDGTAVLMWFEGSNIPYPVRWSSDGWPTPGWRMTWDNTLRTDPEGWMPIP